MKKNIIPVLLIIVGIMILLTGVGLKKYSKNKESKLIEKFNNKIKLQNKNNKEEDEQDNNGKNHVENEKVDLGKEIALIEIPSIGLKSVIVEGIEKEQLRYYIGHFTDTTMPGELGNFSIAGHSSFIYNEILNRLYEVNTGDVIKISTIKDEFNYIITKKFIVEPNEIHVLNQDKNKKTMTIVTCSNRGKKRLIVTAQIDDDM